MSGNPCPPGGALLVPICTSFSFLSHGGCSDSPLPLPHSLFGLFIARSAWFLHAYAPMWFHKLSSVATWVSEIVAPLIMLGPSRLRLLAGLSFLSVMAMISATGNFGTFQILTVALSLLCFDGQPFFRWQTSTASSAKAMARVPKTGKRKCRSCGCRRKLATLIVYVAMTTSLVVGSLFLWHHFYKFSWLVRFSSKNVHMCICTCVCLLA